MWTDSPHVIVDAHNDLVHELVYRQADERPFEQHWLPALRAGGVTVQVCPLYVWWDQIGDRALRSGLEQIAALLRAERENPEVVLIRQTADLDTARQPGRIGLMISIEGAEVIGNDPAMVDIYHALGVRMIGLTHFQRNAFADGNGERSDGGLSALGRQLVARIEDRGIMLDLAHASDRTFEAVMEQTTTASVLVSHSGCRALCNSPRNVTDEQLRALAERDGVLGVFAVPPFLGGASAGVDRVVDHIVHAMTIAGPDHVGLGADFTAQLHACPGLVRLPPWIEITAGDATEKIDGLAGPDGYPRLVERLEQRGVTGDELAGVLHANLLRLFSTALPGSPAGT